jgi:hypothetical protein
MEEFIAVIILEEKEDNDLFVYCVSNIAKDIFKEEKIKGTNPDS